MRQRVASASGLLALASALACGSAVEAGSGGPPPTPAPHATGPSSTSEPADAGFEYRPCLPPASPSTPEPCGPTEPCSTVEDESVANVTNMGLGALSLLGNEPVLAISSNVSPVAGPVTLFVKEPTGWSQVSGPWQMEVGLSNSRNGVLTVGVNDAAYHTWYYAFSGGGLTLIGDIHNDILQPPLLRDACGSTLGLPLNNQSGFNEESWMSIGPARTKRVTLVGSSPVADMALAPNGDLHIVYNVTAGSGTLARWIRNGAIQGDFMLPDPSCSFAFILAATSDNAGGSTPHVVYPSLSGGPSENPPPIGEGTWIHAWADASGVWHKETVLTEDAAHDCLANGPSNQAQVCDEDATFYQIVDATTGPNGSTRWVALSFHLAGSYRASCSHPDAGPPVCRWVTPSPVPQTASLLIGALDGTSLTFTPVPGLSWSSANQLTFGRQFTAIDGTGAIHVGYGVAGPVQYDCYSQAMEIHHLVLRP
jgi:hypothetical protein